MVLNLSKAFDFNSNDEAYHVDYLFTKDKQEDMPAGEDLFLIMHVSVNNNDSTIHKMRKPTSILYQSNEEIEKMIRDETFTFSNQ